MKKRKTLTKISIVFLVLIFAVAAFFLVKLTFTGLFVPKGVDVIQYAGGFTNSETWGKNNVVSNTAILGEYKIVTEKARTKTANIYSETFPIYNCEEDICNVLNYEKSLHIYGTCWATYKIYKNDELIREYPWTTNQIRTVIGVLDVTKLVNKYFPDGNIELIEKSNICHKNNHIIEKEGKYYCVDNDFDFINEENVDSPNYRFLGLDIQLKYMSKYYQRNCLRIENNFVYNLPKDSFSFNVSIPDERVLEGREYYSSIDVINKWKPVKGNLSVVYKIPYKIFGLTREAIETDYKIVEIPTGKSSFKYLIPTDMSYEKIYITPTFDVLMNGSEFSGVNGRCSGQSKQVPLSSCEYVSIGILHGDKFNITIVSKAEELEGKLISKQLEIELLQKDISDLDDLLKEREEIKNGLDSSINQMNNKILSLESKLDQQTNTINTLQTQLDEKSLITLDLEQTQIEQDEKINLLSSILIEKEKSIKELNVLILISDQQINDLIKIINTKKLEINELLNERLIQEKKIAELLKNLEAKEQKLAEIQGLSDEQIAELERIRSLFSEQKIKIDELIGIVEKDNQIISDISQSNENQIQISLKLQQENEDLKIKTVELEDNTNLQESVISDLKKQTELSNLTISELREKLNQEQTHINSFKLKLNESKETVETLKKENEDQKESMERIKKISEDQEDLIKKLKILNNEINDTLSKKSFIQKYMWLIIGILAFFLVITLIALATKKPKRRKR